MARRRQPSDRKVRTREHVIADLGVNHTERQVLLCGYSLERIVRDYGIDLVLFTYNQSGEAEEGHVLLQVKATARTRQTADQQAIPFRITRSDLQRWLAEPMPLILVVYDAERDTAWWLYVQQYFRARRGFNLFRVGETVTVRLPVGQVLNPQAIRLFGQFRDQVLAQLPEDLHQ